MSCFLVCSLEPYGHLLGNGWPLGSLVCDVFLCFGTFLCEVLGQVWYLIVSIPDLCLLTYFYINCFTISNNMVFNCNEARSQKYRQLSTRVVNLGTTTKLCQRNFVPKPHPGYVVVVSRPKIG